VACVLGAERRGDGRPGSRDRKPYKRDLGAIAFQHRSDFGIDGPKRATRREVGHKLANAIVVGAEHVAIGGKRSPQHTRRLERRDGVNGAVGSRAKTRPATRRPRRTRMPGRGQVDRSTTTG
jgi:hypothetical protein